jgi:hypothetical protein
LVVGLAGINLNPYQGLKQMLTYHRCAIATAGINLNPYQGLKLTKRFLAQISGINSRRNQPKSLSGINTKKPGFLQFLGL